MNKARDATPTSGRDVTRSASTQKPTATGKVEKIKKAGMKIGGVVAIAITGLVIITITLFGASVTYGLCCSGWDEEKKGRFRKSASCSKCSKTLRMTFCALGCFCDNIDNVDLGQCGLIVCNCIRRLYRLETLWHLCNKSRISQPERKPDTSQRWPERMLPSN